MTQKIALFGGSFDPIHLGHIEIAKLAKTNFDLDRVDFIPAKQSPFKTKSSFFDSQKRLELIKKAIADFDSFAVADIELKRQEDLSYSYLTVDDYVEKYPEAELFWIMGEDAWSKIDQWKNIDAMKEKISFIVFSRDGTSPLDHLVSQDGFKAHFINNIDLPFSSTHIKERMEQRDLSEIEKSIPQSIKHEVLEVLASR